MKAGGRLTRGSHGIGGGLFPILSGREESVIMPLCKMEGVDVGINGALHEAGSD